MNIIKIYFGKLINKIFFKTIKCKYCSTSFNTFIDKYLHNCYHKNNKYNEFE